jgi:alcohol dehydrogenase class IV
MSSNLEFCFSSSCPRVVFGRSGLEKLPEELRRLGVESPVIVSSPTRVNLAENVRSILQDSLITVASIIDKAIVHVPIDITEQVVDQTQSFGADSIISVGGGSAIGLGKAIAVRTGLPHICVPTTYSGSEMTAILGELKDGRKVARTDPKIMPATVIYDVDLTMQLPKTLTAVSGLNALAHSSKKYPASSCRSSLCTMLPTLTIDSVEALYARGANPVTSILALESISSLASHLPKVIADPSSIEGRSSVLYGAFLAGMTVATTGIALQHKLAHTVAASCGLPHADTHAILLPHTVAYNLPALSEETVDGLGLAFLGRSRVSVDEIISALGTLQRSLGIQVALRDIGMEQEDIQRTADIAMEEPYWNPRQLKKEGILEIIRRAWAGEAPRIIL